MFLLQSIFRYFLSIYIVASYLLHEVNFTVGRTHAINNNNLYSLHEKNDIII